MNGFLQREKGQMNSLLLVKSLYVFETKFYPCLFGALKNRLNDQWPKWDHFLGRVFNINEAEWYVNVIKQSRAEKLPYPHV